MYSVGWEKDNWCMYSRGWEKDNYCIYSKLREEQLVLCRLREGQHEEQVQTRLRGQWRRWVHERLQLQVHKQHLQSCLASCVSWLHNYYASSNGANFLLGRAWVSLLLASWLREITLSSVIGMSWQFFTIKSKLIKQHLATATEGSPCNVLHSTNIQVHVQLANSQYY